MKKRKGFMISCEEANINCDKSQYREASFWEKFKLNIHLIYCRACRRYTAGNSRLSKLMQKDDVDCLNEKEKAALKNAFDKELSNNN
ncbi:MAG: hypothetical protein HKO90_05535 [Flavobacteriaceae bacterium]|nr:hypothetical protein [Bacteroidia bacterium]NNK87723.1 hypothetical protein [Flavobacteriaceae bacterium]